MQINVQKHLALLGLKVKDRVTGFEGVVESLSFDLYGCVQVAVKPVCGKEGKLEDGRWFDVNRLQVTNKRPVMEAPDFDFVGVEAAGYDKGPAEKTLPV